MTRNPSGPPALLAVALVLTIVKSAVLIAFLGLAGLVAVGAIAAGAIPVAAEGATEALPWMAAGGVLAALLLGTLALFEVFKIVVCLQCWRMKRGWLIALVVLTAIGLLLEFGSGSSSACCFLPTLIDLALLVGAGMALAGGRR